MRRSSGRRRAEAPIDIVHAHDWQAGLAPAYLRQHFARHPALAATPSVFTIHNLAYQGIVDKAWLPRLGLGWDLTSRSAASSSGTA